MRRLLVFAAVVVFSQALGPLAQAQRARPTEAEIAEARALFIAGQAAVESERWADAVSSFQRAYSLVHAASALYNVAYALRALGRHRESRDAFERLLTEHEELDDEMAQQAREYLEEERGRVAVLLLMGLDPDTTYTVRLDGEARLDDHRRPLMAEADPGSHTLTVRAPGVDVPFVWEGRLTEGAHQRVPVAFEANAGVVDGDGAPHRGGVLRSPIFWTVVGVVVVGGAVTAGVLLAGGDSVSPQSSRVYDL